MESALRRRATHCAVLCTSRGSWDYEIMRGGFGVAVRAVRRLLLTNSYCVTA
jgi:hypothetical protein